MEFEIHKRSRLDFMRLAIYIENKRGSLILDLQKIWIFFGIESMLSSLLCRSHVLVTQSAF